MAMIVNCVIFVSVEFVFISSVTHSSIIVKDTIGRTEKIEAEKTGIQPEYGYQYGAQIAKERSINASVIPYTEKNSSHASENTGRRSGSIGDGMKHQGGIPWKHMRDVSNGTTSVDSKLTNLEWLERIREGNGRRNRLTGAVGEEAATKQTGNSNAQEHEQQK